MLHFLNIIEVVKWIKGYFFLLVHFEEAVRTDEETGIIDKTLNDGTELCKAETIGSFGIDYISTLFKHGEFGPSVLAS